jgi:hypothetical protein
LFPTLPRPRGGGGAGHGGATLLPAPAYGLYLTCMGTVLAVRRHPVPLYYLGWRSFGPPS